MAAMSKQLCVPDVETITDIDTLKIFLRELLEILQLHHRHIYNEIFTQSDTWKPKYLITEAGERIITEAGEEIVLE